MLLSSAHQYGGMSKGLNLGFEPVIGIFLFFHRGMRLRFVLTWCCLRRVIEVNHHQEVPISGKWQTDKGWNYRLNGNGAQTRPSPVRHNLDMRRLCNETPA